MKKNELINDTRLTPTMEITRSGSKQMFREKNPKDRTFIDSENADVVLQHEKKSMYADLIDGKWYWVEGCAQCNGEPRDWMAYRECEKHDVCRTCSIHRKDLKETPWGGKHGWQCKPCAENERLDKLESAMKSFQDNGLDKYDFLYMDEIKCPHCGTEISSEDIYESQTMYCDICHNNYELTIEYTPSYSTSKICDNG